METVVYIGRDGEFDKNIKRIADALEEQNRINIMNLFLRMLERTGCNTYDVLEGRDKTITGLLKNLSKISEKLKEELELDMRQE